MSIVVAAVALFAGMALSQRLGSKATSTAAAKTIHGVGCEPQEGTGYHIHAHLTILDNGKQTPVPNQAGIGTDCLFWVHTHDSSGIIHIEAPHGIVPTLGAYFDITQYTNGESVLPPVKPGQRMKVFVNMRPYSGRVRAIKLHRHTNIWIEIGPPFEPPKGFRWGQY